VPGKDNGVYTNDFTNNHFELVFDDRAYKSNMIEDIFGNSSYYINDSASNFIKNNDYDNSAWNKTEFWDIETID